MCELSGLNVSAQSFACSLVAASTSATRDRRSAYRLELSPGTPHARGPDGVTFAVKDVSATGSSLLMRGQTAFCLDVLPTFIHLDDFHSLRADLHVVRIAHPAPGATEIGARFGTLTTVGQRTLSRFMIRESQKRNADVGRLLNCEAALRLTDPNVISNIIRGPVGGPCPVLQAVVGSQRLPLTLKVQAVQKHGQRGFIQVIPSGTQIPLEIGHELTFVMPTEGSVVLFTTRILKHDGASILLEIPGEILQTGFRQSARVVILPDTEQRVDFVVPRSSPERLHGRLRDVGARGLSLVIDDERVILFPGDRISQMRVVLPQGRVEVDGIIRSIVPRGDGAGLLCGVELTDFAGSEAARRWHRFVFQQLHPRMTLAGESDVDAAWGVLKQSSYVRLWVPQDEQRHLEQRFAADWKGSVSTNGSLLLLRNERGPVGMISGSLLYPRAWLMHHLGVNEEERTRERRREFFSMADELYSGISYSLRHIAGARYFIAYFERNKRWNQFLYEEFIRRYVQREDQLYEPRNVYRRGTTEAVKDCSPPEGIRIVPGDPDLLRRLSSALRERLPAIEVDALAYNPTEIGLHEWTRNCARRGGYERRRDIYVALNGSGDPLAALVCEAGGDGVNIFGLLNACWVLPLSGGTAVDPTLSRALLAQAVCFYRRVDKRSFVLFEAPGSLGTTPTSVGFEFVSEGVRWIARTEVLPVWRNYIAQSIAARQGDAGTASEAPKRDRIVHSMPERAPALRAHERRAPAVLPALREA